MGISRLGCHIPLVSENQLLKVFKYACGVPEPIQVFDTKFLRQAEIKIGHRHGVMVGETIRFQFPATLASKQNGKIVVRMAIAVAMTASVDDHGIVQDRVPVHVFHRISYQRCILRIIKHFLQD